MRFANWGVEGDGVDRFDGVDATNVMKMPMKLDVSLIRVFVLAFGLALMIKALSSNFDLVYSM